MDVMLWLYHPYVAYTIHTCMLGYVYHPIRDHHARQ